MMKRSFLKQFVALILALVLMTVNFAAATMNIEAAIKDATVFSDVDWQYMGESPIISDTGWLQSMCSTKDYIVCLENSSTKESTPDTFLAFYKNNVDENGNPVEQYSLAKTVTETDYEHANGMTYNPNTNEIIVVGSTPLDAKNRGIAYIVDASTLKLKRTVKVSNNYKLLGVAYSEETNHYVFQLFNDGYTESYFVETDMNFQQVGDAFPARMWQDIRHQDFCISGDYLISLAFTNEVSNSNVMHIYSVSEKELLVEYDLDILENGGFIEPESICEMGPGQILIGNAMTNPRRITFYGARVAAAFKLNTSVENGTITGSQKTVDYGSDYTVNYEPIDNYEVDTITIDGQNINPEEHPNFYVFEMVSQNHSIDVKFKEKPKFNLTTSVENGFIDASVVRHRDNDWTVAYGPNEHYELSEVLIDGASVDADNAQSQYTFENIQDNHHIEVKFSQIPSFEITTNVKNGQITASEPKIYRDEDYTVFYKPNKDYSLAWIEVDGDKTFFFEMKDNWNDYTFENIQGAHTISVVYYWTWLPWIAAGTAILLFIFFASLICLDAGYMYRKRMRRRYKRCRRIRQQREKNRAVAEAKVRAKMEREARIRKVNREDFVDK